MSAVELSKEEVPRFFGTDGIRGRAGEGMLAPAAVARVFAATARVLEAPDRFGEDFPSVVGRRVLVGRDTRESGRWLLEVITGSLSEHGYEVLDTGVLPTPGVSFLCRTWDSVALGVVISASHNPAADNGVKFFAPSGAKISPDFERAVEAEYAHGHSPSGAEPMRRVPTDRSVAAREAYVESLVQAVWKPERLHGRKIVLDTANGATFQVAPEVFRRLGMAVEVIGDQPDGTNINDGVGALHPGRLAELAQNLGAGVGVAFDGDGDRVIPVTAAGTVLDGDHVLALVGKYLQEVGKIPNKKVVATSMSNIGLEVSLAERGLELVRTDVGDRNVYLEMIAGLHPVGGEQSGHTIFLDDALTGDGLLTALRLLDVLDSDELDLESERHVMKRYPQILKNVPVSEKRPFEEISGVLDEVAAVERELAGRGRVVLRYSGTELLARVMVEGPDTESAESYTNRICAAILR